MTVAGYLICPARGRYTTALRAWVRRRFWSHPWDFRQLPGPQSAMADCGRESAAKASSNEDAEGEPDGRRRVAANNVTQVMNAQVNSAEPDKQHKRCQHHDSRPARKSSRAHLREQVSQKAVGDQRTQCVTARKTPAGLGDPRFRQLGTQALNHRF